MGNFIYFEKKNPESNYDLVEIYRSDDEQNYSLIATQNAADNSFYDESGGGESTYRIRFKDSEHEQFSDYSVVVQTNESYLYVNPIEAIESIGLDRNNLPEPLTLNMVFDIIWDVSSGIDDLTQTVYGRQEEFEEVFSSRYFNMGRVLDLEKRNIIEIEVSERNTINEEWRILTEGRDYTIDYKTGLVSFYSSLMSLSYGDANNVKVSGKYGKLTVPDLVRRYAKHLVGMKINNVLAGGDPSDDITRFNMGGFSYMQERNVEGKLQEIEEERRRLLSEAGLSESKTKIKLI